MTTPTCEELVKGYWSASTYVHRYPGENTDQIQKMLRHIAKHATGALKQRATELIEEKNEPDCND